MEETKDIPNEIDHVHNEEERTGVYDLSNYRVFVDGKSVPTSMSCFEQRMHYGRYADRAMGTARVALGISVVALLLHIFG